MAARVDPRHASARHQALHHFVAKAEWSDEEMLERVAQWVVPKMDRREGGVLDHRRHGIPEEGHALGRGGAAVLWGAGQAGQLPGGGEPLAGTEQGSVPVAYRLYLPQEWAEDASAAPRGGSAGRGIDLRPSRRSRLSSSKDCWRRRAQALRVWPMRLRGGHRFSPAAERIGAGLYGGHNLGGGGLAAGRGAASGQALQRHGPTAGNAAAHAHAPAGERQGAGEGCPPVPFRRSAGERAATRLSAAALRRCAYDMRAAIPAEPACDPSNGC